MCHRLTRSGPAKSCARLQKASHRNKSFPSASRLDLRPRPMHPLLRLRKGRGMSIESIRTVGVLGAGTMGNGIAHIFARAGYKVWLRDVEQHFLDRALDSIAKNLDREIKKGKLKPEEKGTGLARLVPVTDLSTISNRDFWVEPVPRKPQLKPPGLTES